MASALAYCKGAGPKPVELDVARMIERFGAQAVYGRPMTAAEMRRIMLTENVVDAYESRKASKNFAEWSERHPNSAQLLAEAERAYRDGE